MQAAKTGFYYVIDRVTGQFISGQPFVQVTWAKGLDEATGRPIVNPEAHYGADSIAISPATGGGHNWSPMSWNPGTGLVYIPATVSSSSIYAVDPNYEYHPGQKNKGVTLGPKNLPPPPAIGPELPEGIKGGALIAWDPVTQTRRWIRPGGGGTGGGTVTTAGNLVFQVINDGRLLAYTADKGEKVLDIQTGLRGGMGPPITYELDGKQYITLAGGIGTGVPPRPAAAGEPPRPPASEPTARPKLLTFVLDGKAPLPEAKDR
jgi:quinohemoprotein ethanol dehydrogenase